jgi:FkbM family methyltransferase
MKPEKAAPLKSLLAPLSLPARMIYRAIGGGRGEKKQLRKSDEWKMREARDQANIDRLLRESLTEGSNCIDAGAIEGTVLRQFTRLAPRGNHMAFEPIPALADKLRQAFPSVDVRQCALGAETGRASFCYVPARPAWSGLRRQPYPEGIQPQEISVDIFRLDDLVPSDARVAFLKIDVEGAELEVLQGAVETIKRTGPTILFEHARIHNTEYATTPAAIHTLLSDRCGMALFCLDGTGPLTLEELSRIYDESHASGYGRLAQTNFVARPR